MEKSLPPNHKMNAPRSPRPPKTKKKITIHDVAREAEVSIYTVSRTLNNVPGVNPETREKVLEICRRLGVRPRPVAKRLHFALIIPEASSYEPGSYIPMISFQMLTELSNRGMGLTLFTDGGVKELSRLLFDGIFSVSGESSTAEVLSSIDNTPVVVINRFSMADRFHVVGWDHRAEGSTVAEYLINRGHRRLAFVAEPPASRHSTQSRLAGYRERCLSSGIGFDAHLVELLESRDQLVAALSRIVKRKADAIYLPAQGKLGPEALNIVQHILRVKVPEEISVVGGEHAGWSSLFDPPLTTVDAPIEQLARRSVDHMLGLIEKRPTEPTEVLLATPIIERKSVVDRR